MSDEIYKFVVEGFDKNYDTPEYSNAVKTEFGKKLVEKRFKDQGLNVATYEYGKHYGLNPHYEEEI